MTDLERELKKYSEIRFELYSIKEFGGTSIEAAVKYATMDMVNELDRFATDKVNYMKSENEYLLECLSKLKAEKNK